ncbi:MAG: protein O-mannosyl-transferase, partial [Actinomycetota bacterium]|nr:protein O-mannosyl-transferase [Actinomycetota bacterium]
REWADDWRDRNWPLGTPRYIFHGYPRLLQSDPEHLRQVVGDVAWCVAAIREVGPDEVAATLAESLRFIPKDHRTEVLLSVVSEGLRQLRSADKDSNEVPQLLALGALQRSSLDMAQEAVALTSVDASSPTVLWASPKHAPVLRVGRHPCAVTALAALSPEVLLSAGEDGRVVLWHSDRPGDSQLLGSHGAPIRCMAALTEATFVTGGDDCRVMLWGELNDGKPPRCLGRHDAPVRCVAALSGDSFVTGGDDNGVLLWSADSREGLVELGRHKGSVWCACTLDQYRVARAGRVGRVLLWDLRTPGFAVCIGSHRGPVRALARLDSSRLVAWSEDGRIWIWSVDKAAAAVQMGVHNSLSAIAVVGGTVVTFGHDRRARTWDPQIAGRPMHVETDDEVVRAAVPWWGQQIVAADAKGAISLWQRSGSSDDIPHRHPPTAAVCIALLSDHQLVTGDDSGDVYLWNTSTSTPPTLVGRHPAPVAVLWAIDNHRFATIANGDVFMWNIRRPGKITQRLRHTRACCLGSTIDGRLLVGGEDGVVRAATIDSVLNRAEIREFGHHTGAVSAIAAHDTSLVVTAGMDRRLRQWDLNLPGVVTEIGRTTSVTKTLALLGTAAIVTGGEDGRLTHWPLDRPGAAQTLCTLEGAVHAVYSLGRDRVLVCSAQTEVGGGGQGTTMRLDVLNVNDADVPEWHASLKLRAVDCKTSQHAGLSVALAHDPVGLSVWGSSLGSRASQVAESTAAEAAAAQITGNLPGFLALASHDASKARSMLEVVIAGHGDDAVRVGFQALSCELFDPDPKVAEDLYASSLRMDPTNAFNLGNYARHLDLRIGDVPTAELMYRRALEENPLDVALLFDFAAMKYRSQGDFKGLEICFLGSLREDPGNARVQGEYALFLWFALGQIDKAEQVFRQLARSEPTSPMHVVFYAWFVYLTRHDVATARSILSQHHPNTQGADQTYWLDPPGTTDTLQFLDKALRFRAYRSRESVQKQQSHPEITYLGHLYSLAPDESTAWIAIAVFLCATGQETLGREIGKRLVLPEPHGAVELACNAMVLAHVLGDERAARSIFYRATAEDPTDPDVAAEHVEFLVSTGDLTGADRVRQLHWSMTSGPVNDLALERLADFLAAEGEVMYALEACEVDIAKSGTIVPSPGQYALSQQDMSGDDDRAEALFRQALAIGPPPAWLLGGFAVFLSEVRGDHDRAQELFERALAAGPASPWLLGRFAVFLSEVRGDHSRAEECYRRALPLDHWHGETLGNYAVFLSDVRGEYARARNFFERALAARSVPVWILARYALLRSDVPGKHAWGQDLFGLALAAGTASAWLLARYAVLMTDVRGDHDRAQALFERALAARSIPVWILGSYAVFMTDVRGDHDRAQELYEQALAADPTRAHTLGNYANFMEIVRGDHDRAQALYERALAADPTRAHTLGSYAVFMTDVRGDHDRAQALYESALAARSIPVWILGSYANFMTDVRGDHDRAQELYEQAVAADPTDANILGNYANFMKNVRGDHDRAQALYERALAADPTDANILGNYANF